MAEEHKRLGDYEIVRELGHGGMGRLPVRNVISDRVEAMKVLLPDLVQQGELAIALCAKSSCSRAWSTRT